MKHRNQLLMAAIAMLFYTGPGLYPMSLDAAQSPTPAPATAMNLRVFLPDAGELDGEWTVQSEGERTREEVIELIGDQGDELIETLEWKANVFRNFERTNVTDPDSFYEPTALTVSIHAFADSTGAADALKPLSEWVAVTDGVYAARATVAGGDDVRAFAGLDGRLPMFVLYVQKGNLVIRVGAVSMLGDPREAVIEIAELVLDKANA